MIESDVIIVGGGPVGCVLANKLSNELNLKCLIIEKRNHIAGNCYDEYNKKGLLYHKYGPHYLRFKNRKTLNYLSKFTIRGGLCLEIKKVPIYISDRRLLKTIVN